MWVLTDPEKSRRQQGLSLLDGSQQVISAIAIKILVDIVNFDAMGAQSVLVVASFIVVQTSESLDIIYNDFVEIT
jgi:hypothetical protein